MIGLDSHALVWWTLAPERLSAAARHAIDAADLLGVPAIVFWEVALLSRKRKVHLGTSAAEWTRDVLSLPRIRPLLLTPEIAVLADSLAMHSDPADRLIVATAVEHGIVLVTKDAAIRKAALTQTLW